MIKTFGSGVALLSGRGGSPLKCNVVVNHHVGIVRGKKRKAAREAAIKNCRSELAKLKKRQQAKRENNTEAQTQLTLFDKETPRQNYKWKSWMEQEVSPVSEAQKRYAYKHCFVHYSSDAKGNCFCLIVGTWRDKEDKKTVNVLIAVKESENWE